MRRFGYRASVFKRNERYVVTSVRFELEVGDSSVPLRYAELTTALGVEPGAQVPLKDARETVVALRRRKGMVVDAGDPDSVRAGSFFVNPVVDAARLAARSRRRPVNAPPASMWETGSSSWPQRGSSSAQGSPRGWGAGRGRGLAQARARPGEPRSSDGSGAADAARSTIRDARSGGTRFGVELEPEPVLVGCSWGSG